MVELDMNKMVFLNDQLPVGPDSVSGPVPQACAADLQGKAIDLASGL